jgi:hypothetical protein
MSAFLAGGPTDSDVVALKLLRKIPKIVDGELAAHIVGSTRWIRFWASMD